LKSVVVLYDIAVPNFMACGRRNIYAMWKCSYASECCAQIVCNVKDAGKAGGRDVVS
jgi:hypothetical protein